MKHRSFAGNLSTAVSLAVLLVSPALAQNINYIDPDKPADKPTQKAIHFEPPYGYNLPHVSTAPIDTGPFVSLIPEPASLPVVHFPEAPYTGEEYSAPVTKRPSGLARFFVGAAYVAGRGLQGAAQGYNNYNYNNPRYMVNTLGPTGAHSFTVQGMGNTTFVNQTY